ncbi:MAG: hypothetical protein K9N51_04185 [Candidatus Pacebacteria bacterium]|nr:hypothetical protein [Candidatus Paceibacterota bacterium]
MKKTLYYTGYLNVMKITRDSIMAGQETRDQVILPLSVAFGICMRGLKTRLGRSIITLTGVALGIAFLMSVISSFHIREAMQAEAEEERRMERSIAVLRAEIGRVSGKTLFVAAGVGTETGTGFITALMRRNVEVIAIAAPGVKLAPETKTDNTLNAVQRADAIILLGDASSLLNTALVNKIGNQRIYAYELPDAAAQARLTGAGTAITELGIELRPEELDRQKERTLEARFRMYWIVGISLLITVGGITNAMLMSVTERFREIATMKCLGALSSFVVKLFLIESSLMGFWGSLFGVVIGIFFPLIAYSYSYGIVAVFTGVSFPILLTAGVACIIIGIILSVVAGIYPARVAARMIPADALASDI